MEKKVEKKNVAVREVTEKEKRELQSIMDELNEMFGISFGFFYGKGGPLGSKIRTEDLKKLLEQVKK